jgi:LacI family transcriptional regulator
MPTLALIALQASYPDSVRLLGMTPHIQLLRKHASLGEQWFGIDDAQALYQATKHLLDLGHRRIAYIGSSADLPTGAARVKGFQNALAGVKGSRGFEEVGAPGSTDFARDTLRRLLAQLSPPTAVVTGSVQHTVGVLEALRITKSALVLQL